MLGLDTSSGGSDHSMNFDNISLNSVGDKSRDDVISLDNFVSAKNSVGHVPRTANADGLTLSICFVDNSHDRILHIQNNLHAFGHAVYGFDNAADALQAVTHTQYDVILIGYLGAAKPALIQAVRRSTYAHVSQMAVVALTSDMKLQEVLLRYGADVVLPFSLTGEQLHQSLADMFMFAEEEEPTFGEQVMQSAKKLTICVLENNAAVPLSDELRTAGHTVDTFFASWEAIKALQLHEYDAVIISEPHPNVVSHGAHVIRSIRAGHGGIRKLPFVVVTTEQYEHQARSFYQLNRAELLTQPLHFDLSDYVIHTLLDNESSLGQTEPPRLAAPTEAPRLPHIETETHSGPDSNAQGAGFSVTQNHVSAQDVAPSVPEGLQNLGHDAHAYNGANSQEVHHTPDKEEDTSKATHDPLLGVFRKLKEVSDRFHGDEENDIMR